MWARRTVEAVHKVSIEVQPGEIVGMVGESGSGKTTVGKLCLGVLQPTVGKVHSTGIHPSTVRVPRPDGGCPQHPEWALNPRLKVGMSAACR
jgi:ABC-type glutathione transport system ATPase component